MKSYYLEGLDNTDTYRSFVEYMIEHSNEFSVVYLRFSDGKLKKSMRKIKEELKPFHLRRAETNVMPSMITLNGENGHYILTYYLADEKALPILKRVDSIMEWDYPKMPMDLCFFRDGYAWFVSSAHEGYCILYTDDPNTLEEIRGLGITTEYNEDIPTDKLFFSNKKYDLEELCPEIKKWKKNKKK